VSLHICGRVRILWLIEKNPPQTTPFEWQWIRRVLSIMAHVKKKKFQRKTVVTALRIAPEHPSMRVGVAYTIRRDAIDRFTLSTPNLTVTSVQVQVDGTVALIAGDTTVIISAHDYANMIDLDLPGGHHAHRRGHLPLTPGMHQITTQDAAAILGVTPRKVLSWVHDGTLPTATTTTNVYGKDCYLLDLAIVCAPATQTALAARIAAFQQRRQAQGARRLKAASMTHIAVLRALDFEDELYFGRPGDRVRQIKQQARKQRRAARSQPRIAPSRQHKAAS